MRHIARLVAVLAILVTQLGWFAGSARAESSGSRWIDVDLSNQTATAMVGDSAVYTAYVTTGKSGFDTPTGTFSILRRVYNETMDSSTTGIPNGAPGGYYLTGVLYTQYFTGDGAALHFNYWSSPSVFGSVPTSHGCVGMDLADSAYFWDFADIGTPVYIHY